MMVLGGATESLTRRHPRAWRTVAVAGLVLVILGTWRSAIRQPVWKDNGTLFAQTVVDAPHNYRAHWSYGLYLYEHGEKEAAFRSLQSAMTLFPYDASLYNDVGDVYRTDGHCEQSIPLYQKALLLNPDLRYTRSRMASCYMRLGDYGSARLELRKLVNAGYPEFEPLIQAVDSAAAAAGAFR
jgi:tetratricopeptide (TPR) repeat protein